MKTLPLYDMPAHADGWHRVRSPGGYESWYFDAEDRAAGVYVAVTFFEGFVFHPGYLRRWGRYRRNPTRHLPPLPEAYPCVHAALYWKGKLLAQSTTQYPPAEFRALADRPDVRIGRNDFTLTSAGAYRVSTSAAPWKRTWHGPQLLDDETLDVNLEFRPRAAHGVERELFGRNATGADHRWIIAAPLCDVTGVVRFASNDFRIAGSGYHDHYFGSGPLGIGLQQQMWGRVLLEDRAVTFHLARPRNRLLADEIHLLEATPEGTIEIPVHQLTHDWTGWTATLLNYPKRVQMDNLLSLENPRIVGSSSFSLRLMYDALWQGQSSQAFCEVAYPHRLRWPVLGRVIEMSINTRP